MGAPLENITVSSGARQRGCVYICNVKLSSTEKCQIIKIDNGGN